PGTDQFMALLLALRPDALGVAESVEDPCQPAPGNFRRIQQLDGAGSEISRIGVERFARFFPRLVDALKLLQSHENLTADFNHLRPPVAGEPVRKPPDGPDIRRDVVALDSVAARDGPHHPAALISQTHGN